MCGIAGYIGKKELSESTIHQLLNLMKNRGPDYQSYKKFILGNRIIYLFHSRLSIIDLDSRSHQPFQIGNYWIIFNGEIYNFPELKLELQKSGVNFRTNSDTEVLLNAYILYGDSCVKKFEGMWSFAILDIKNNHIFASRDRFGEKPFYYYSESENFYFGSEIKFINRLLPNKLSVNNNQLLRYSILGYKSLYKYNETYFTNLKELPASYNLIIEIENLSFHEKRYWSPSISINNNMKFEHAVEGTKERLLESMRIRLRSDVPLAFCLSGGVDSASLASIASKIFNYNTVAFSIIDSDERYNETENILATVNDIGCKHHMIHLDHSDGLNRLKKLIEYHDAPIATITYYVHSMLSEAIHKQGYKVAFSGTSADELFTGYYDHFLLHLNEIKDSEVYSEALNSWEEYILPVVRNHTFRNQNLYSDNPNYREHVFDGYEKNLLYCIEEYQSEYREENYSDSLLRNRMLNELFNEVTPVILHEDDLNSMMYSIENRSPYLDTKLMEFAYSIPAPYLIRDGFAKFVLRESMKGVLNEKVRTDRVKKGFNASIHSIIDFKDPIVKEYLLEQNSEVFKIFDRNKIQLLLDKDFLPNDESKFLFNFVNLRIFLEDQL
ncbi:MAG: asparagine synthase (glutamine-hydrolyzing) [Leptospiraceae bacterium]|nr:asparagine synthase (glutamine-hydrolyzing) [Leptospiraceae bacterium]